MSFKPRLRFWTVLPTHRFAFWPRGTTVWTLARRGQRNDSKRSRMDICPGASRPYCLATLRPQRSCRRQPSHFGFLAAAFELRAARAMIQPPAGRTSAVRDDSKEESLSFELIFLAKT